MMKKTLLPRRLANFVVRGAHEIRIRDTRNLDGILKREEDTGVGPRFRLHREQVLALVLHRPARDLVPRVPGEHLSECRFSGPVRPHDGVDLTGKHFQTDPLEDFLVGNSRV